jgi:hypothetical protein
MEFEPGERELASRLLAELDHLSRAAYSSVPRASDID